MYFLHHLDICVYRHLATEMIFFCDFNRFNWFSASSKKSQLTETSSKSAHQELKLMWRRLRASSGSQLELLHQSHVTYLILNTTYQTHTSNLAVYLNCWTSLFPLCLPMHCCPAPALLPALLTPPPPQHPPVGSDGGFKNLPITPLISM